LKSIGRVAVLVSYLLVPCGQLHAEEPAPLLEFRLADNNETAGWKEMEVRGSSNSVFVSDEVALTGRHVEKVSFDKDENSPLLLLTLTEEGAKAMREITSRNLNKKLAIVLNGKVVSAPTIRSTITKNVAITGQLFDSNDLVAFQQAVDNK